jgi:outer membrane protein
MNMTAIKPIVAAALLGLALSAGAQAADLTQVYQDAKAHDAEYAAARAALEAGREKLPQGRALLLPTLGISGSSTRTDLDVRYDGDALPREDRDYRASGFTLSLSQPLLRPQNWLQYLQSEKQVAQAEATFGNASQSLILRTAQAYFDVLAAQDALAFARAQKTAIAEQLEQARHNFEAGNSTITDVHEAQARHDLAVSQEIAGQNDLDIKRRALQRLTGQDYDTLRVLPTQLTLTPPDTGIERWKELAETQSYAVIAQQALVEVQQLEVRRNRAGHLPTIDLVASYGDTDQTGSQLTAIGSRVKTGVIGLQVSTSLFAGGGISSRTREAAALYEKARADYDNTRRQQALAAQQYYLSVVNGIAQVRALEQALASSQSALESNKTGYEVGVRINIDVLNAQQQVYSTQRDLALARYRAILDQLQLKATAGALQETDLDQVNATLAGGAAQPLRTVLAR